MIRRPPRSTRVRSSAASDVYKRQTGNQINSKTHPRGSPPLYLEGYISMLHFLHKSPPTDKLLSSPPTDDGRSLITEKGLRGVTETPFRGCPRIGGERNTVSRLPPGAPPSTLGVPARPLRASRLDLGCLEVCGGPGRPLRASRLDLGCLEVSQGPQGSSRASRHLETPEGLQTRFDP